MSPEKLLPLLMASLLFAVVVSNCVPEVAKCAWCPKVRCSIGTCPGDCVCLLPSGSINGSCVGIGLKEES